MIESEFLFRLWKVQKRKGILAEKKIGNLKCGRVENIFIKSNFGVIGQIIEVILYLHHTFAKNSTFFYLCIEHGVDIKVASWLAGTYPEFL